jgi:hypothetical protein
MTDKHPLQITRAEVLEQALEFNFEFFADLIRYRQPIEEDARAAAADFVLGCLTGTISKRMMGRTRTTMRYSQIANRVAELEPVNGLESAVVDVAGEIKQDQRTVWTAWQLRCAQQKFAENALKAVADLMAKGASEKEKEEAIAKLMAAHAKKTQELLKRKS